MSEDSQQHHADSTLYLSTWIWFGVMLLVGVALTALGAATDRFMYESGAKVVDIEAARSNFVGVSGFGAQVVDPRSRGGLADTRQALELQHTGS